MENKSKKLSELVRSKAILGDAIITIFSDGKIRGRRFDSGTYFLEKTDIVKLMELIQELYGIDFD